MESAVRTFQRVEWIHIAHGVVVGFAVELLDQFDAGCPNLWRDLVARPKVDLGAEVKDKGLKGFKRRLL